MKTCLITGCNRGIGASLLPAYLEKGYRVVAAVRDPSSMKPQDNVVVVKIDAESLTDASEAVQELKTKHGIDRLDLVIANAAVGGPKDEFKDLDMARFEKSWKVNVRGPIVLYQAVRSLIPSPEGKFVVISSGAGTIGQKHNPGGGSYGHSKAALNFCITKLNVENDIPILAIDPGWLQTDMGNEGARNRGMEQAPAQGVGYSASVHFSLIFGISGIIKVIHECKKDTTSGKMVKWDGTVCPW